MQLDRQLKSDKELNASVELVKELSAGEFNLSDVRVTWTNMYNDEEWRAKIGTVIHSLKKSMQQERQSQFTISDRLLLSIHLWT